MNFNDDTNRHYDYSGYTPLHMLAKYADDLFTIGTTDESSEYQTIIDILNILLDNGADLNAKFAHTIAMMTDRPYGVYCNNFCVKEPDYSLPPKIYIDKNYRGMTVDDEPAAKESPLHIILNQYSNNYDTDIARENMAIAFIEAGSDVEAMNESGNKPKPLYLAAYHGYLKLIEHILKITQDINEEDEMIAYDDEYLQSIIGNSPINGALNGYYKNPLQQFNLIKLLISKNIDINGKDRDGNTPLLLAAEIIDIEDKEIFELLINSGANLYARNKQDATLMHKAAYSHNINLLKILIEKGLDINAKDNQGKTPVHYALVYITGGHPVELFVNTVDFLIKNGADLDIKDSNGMSILHKAIEFKLYDVIRFLIEVKVDLSSLTQAEDLIVQILNTNYQNHRNYNAVERDELIKLFLKEGINIDYQYFNKLNFNTSTYNISQLVDLVFIENLNEDQVRIFEKNISQINNQSDLDLFIDRFNRNLIKKIIENKLLDTNNTQNNDVQIVQPPSVLQKIYNNIKKIDFTNCLIKMVTNKNLNLINLY